LINAIPHFADIYSVENNDRAKVFPLPGRYFLPIYIGQTQKADPVENTRFARNFNRITCKVFDKIHS